MGKYQDNMGSTPLGLYKWGVIFFRRLPPTAIDI